MFLHSILTIWRMEADEENISWNSIQFAMAKKCIANDCIYMQHFWALEASFETRYKMIWMKYESIYVYFIPFPAALKWKLYPSIPNISYIMKASS